MPNKELHRPVGVVAGAVTAGLLADKDHWFLETLGGSLGGWLGAAMPDWIDPPTSPNHRDLAHGVLSAGGCLVALLCKLNELQVRLRTRASELEQTASRSPATSKNLLLAAAACRLGAGLIAGFLAGYACHLIQDSRTPARLPVLCRSERTWFTASSIAKAG